MFENPWLKTFVYCNICHLPCPIKWHFKEFSFLLFCKFVWEHFGLLHTLWNTKLLCSLQTRRDNFINKCFVGLVSVKKIWFNLIDLKNWDFYNLEFTSLKSNIENILIRRSGRGFNSGLRGVRLKYKVQLKQRKSNYIKGNVPAEKQ